MAEDTDVHVDSLSDTDSVPEKDMFPQVCHRLATPTTGSIPGEMADRKQIATFEPRFRMEVLFFDDFSYFSYKFLFHTNRLLQKNFGVNLPFKLS